MPGLGLWLCPTRRVRGKLAINATVRVRVRVTLTFSVRVTPNAEKLASERMTE